MTQVNDYGFEMITTLAHGLNGDDRVERGFTQLSVGFCGSYDMRSVGGSSVQPCALLNVYKGHDGHRKNEIDLEISLSLEDAKELACVLLDRVAAMMRKRQCCNAAVSPQEEMK